DSVSVSLPVLLFAFLLSAAVATGLGAFTAARATRGDLRKGLVEGGRGQAGSQARQRGGRGVGASGRVASQPARGPCAGRSADRYHIGARDRCGFAGTQLAESARGESGL